jgi:hypothetical protein
MPKLYGAFGSNRRGAQTPIELWQNSRNYENPVNQIKTEMWVHYDLYQTLQPDTQYLVYHKWKKALPLGHYHYLWPHHSHIFVTDPFDGPITNFGVGTGGTFFQKKGIITASGDHDAKNPFILSESYRPNPVQITGKLILVNFEQTLKMCGSTYNVLFNNCQKFARIFMQKCGALHYRHPLHP